MEAKEKLRRRARELSIDAMTKRLNERFALSVTVKRKSWTHPFQTGERYRIVRAAIVKGFSSDRSTWFMTTEPRARDLTCHVWLGHVNEFPFVGVVRMSGR